jgi:uncharacterized protein (TIGR02147 family)
MSRNQVINIFKYVDYRFFLADYYAARKRARAGFSYRSFALEAGLSASLLKDILTGRQNLTIASMQKYAKAMNLSENETEYFEALVRFNNSSENSEKNRYFGEMVRLRGRSAVRFLDIKEYEYFSKWYHAVVRELVTRKDIGDNPEIIAKMVYPRLTEAQVRKSIALLSQLDLIYKDDTGLWHATDKVISSEYEVQSVALKNYHNEMLERARFALDHFPGNAREFQGLTLSAGSQTFGRIKERIRAFSDELLSMVANDTESPDRVFQVNIHLFPFTEQEEKR